MWRSNAGDAKSGLRELIHRTGSLVLHCQQDCQGWHVHAKIQEHGANYQFHMPQRAHEGLLDQLDG
jgi:hypothetical protein